MKLRICDFVFVCLLVSGCDSLLAVPDPKPKQVTVEVDNKPSRQAVFANIFSIEFDGPHLIVHFGARTEMSEAAETVAVCINVNDLQNQKASFEKYIQDVSAFVENSNPAPPNRHHRYSPKFIGVSNIVQLARTGSSAETTFSHFGIHDLVVPKKGQQGEPLKAEPKLLIRSGLQMQYAMVCEMLEILQPHG